MKAGGGSARRRTGKGNDYAGKRIKEKVKIENPTEFAQDQKLDETDRAIQQVFIGLDTDRSGELDLGEFHQALKQMEIILPVPVVRFLFEAIDVNNSGDISFDEFIKFLGDTEKRLDFQAEYVAEFRTEKIGLELVLMPNESEDGKPEDGNRVIVANILDDDTRNYVLPNSEVIMIDNQTVQNKTTDEIKNLLHEKLVRSSEPCKITFKKTSHAPKENQKMLGLMMGDEDWLVLSKHISNEKLKTMIRELKRPKDLGVRTKHCPIGDPNTNWWVWIHLTFEDETFSRTSNFVVSFVTMLIFVSTLAYVLQTIPSLRGDDAFVWIESFVSICFSLEYAARIFSSRNAWIFFVDHMCMIDFLAIIPWWVEISFGEGGGSILRVIRVVRLARVFRLLKTPTFNKFFNIFYITVVKSTSSAGLLITIISLAIIIFASLMYFAEQGTVDEITGIKVRSDDAPSPFISIPAGAWWCVVTMTTVGYGDMYPIETLGMVVATFAMFIGLFVIALPVIIIGGHFEDTYEEFRQKDARQKRLDKMKRDNTFEQSVEHFFKRINDTINAASGVQDVYVPFFTPEDVTHFVNQMLDTEEKLVEVLKAGRHSIHFLPREVPEYKLFVLYEVFGKLYRSDEVEADKFAKVKKHLVSKIQMI
jgi:voltage-gated potassium channel Kch